MTAALDKLAYYFGYVGLASIVVWVLTALLSALFIVGLRRSLICWTALILATGGVVLSRVNSAYGSSEHSQAARQQAALQEAEDEQPRPSAISDEAVKAKQEEAAEKKPGAAKDLKTPGVMEMIADALKKPVNYFYFYFGFVGIASIVVWLFAALLSALFIVGWRRSLICWTALVLAIGGVVLSRVNSAYVSAIKIDWSEQIEAARQRAELEAAEEEPSRDTDVSDEAVKAKQEEAAEKDPGATGDLPELDEPADQGDSKTGDESGDESEKKKPAYSYRQAGKVERAEGKKTEEKIALDAGTEDQPIELNVRSMKMKDVAQANRLDRLNLLLARLTFCLAAVLVVVDYFRRFNKTFESYLPLPVGGRLVDSLFAKSHTVCIAAARKPDWPKFLRRTVRKGETFLYFGRQDPLQLRYLTRLPGCPVPPSLQKVVLSNGEPAFDDEFLFESAWFGRYCFVLTGDGPRAVGRLNALADFLQLRHETRASAVHTVNVLWDLDTPIPKELLDRLLPLCRDVNFRLILTTNETLDKESAARFEDVYA